MVALQNAIQDGIGDGRVTNPGMPVLNRKLAGNDRGLVGCSVVDDLQQIRARRAVNRAHASVVQDQDIGLGELEQPFSEGATAVPDTEFFL